MPKQFWQCDVTDREDNIWTGPVVYGSHQEAEFQTMLVLQQDWGDDYMPDGFLDQFGRTEGESLFNILTAEFPGDDAWDELGFWDELDVNTFMLQIDPVTALAKLGKISCAFGERDFAAVMAGSFKAKLELTFL